MWDARQRSANSTITSTACHAAMLMLHRDMRHCCMTGKISTLGVSIIEFKMLGTGLSKARPVLTP